MEGNPIFLKGVNGATRLPADYPYVQIRYFKCKYCNEKDITLYLVHEEVKPGLVLRRYLD